MKALKYAGLIAIITALSFTTTFVMAAYQRHEARKVTMEYVYNICNASRLEDDGASENECGDIEDRTDTEFLCKANNASPSNKCWVEDKR